MNITSSSNAGPETRFFVTQRGLLQIVSVFLIQLGHFPYFPYCLSVEIEDYGTMPVSVRREGEALSLLTHH